MLNKKDNWEQLKDLGMSKEKINSMPEWVTRSEPEPEFTDKVIEEGRKRRQNRSDVQHPTP